MPEAQNSELRNTFESMKLGKLLERVNCISIQANPDTEIGSVCYDSRKAEKNCLFVAVKGLHSDGSRFIPNVMEKGCAVAVCEDLPGCDCPYVLVPDAREALAMISCAFYDYPAEKMKIIGITGTSGKTTSTNLIKHILETHTGKPVGLVGTNGNMIGREFIHTEYTTPESCELQELFARMVSAGCEYAIMEVSSHSLAMKRVAGIHYSTAAFTNLSQDHLDFHNTMHEYASVKRTLFSVCDRACINMDDEWSMFMLEGISCPVMKTSATDSSVSLWATNITAATDGVVFDAVFGSENAEICLHIPGMFSVYNALTAVSVCMAEGLSLQECADALFSADGVKGRMESVLTDGDYSVIIDYSHKPDALEKVLKTLRPVTKGRLICLFGCGGDRDRAKRPIMGRVAAENADIVIVTSDNPRTEDPEAIIAEILPGLQDLSTQYEVVCDRIKAIHRAIDMANAGDVILLAGKGHEDYQVIGTVKHHMDEREIVADYLKIRKP